MADRIVLAAVAGAHGIGGELRLKLFTDSAESLARHDAVFVGGREHQLLSTKAAGKGAIIGLEGVNDRSTAEALRGALIEVARAALAPLEEGEYYYADIIGLPCVDVENRPVGTVVSVENFGAGDLLEVENVEGKRALLPFRSGIADLQGGRIVIDPLFLA